jgi:amidase
MSGVRRPTAGELREVGGDLEIELAERDWPAAAELVDEFLEAYDRLAELDAAPARAPGGERDAGRVPSAQENPLGAWARLTDVAGPAGGPLAGRTIAIKDNVAVAGVPLTNGSAVFSYVPAEDATVVRRLLEAGGRVAGVAVCEDLCYSGGSHTAATGPVANPYDHTRAAGGSSSGSAALVAAGVVDLAIGGDQGGSIRVPSAWCGVCGLKPTWGLVPYTGAAGMDPTIDHLGPIARSAREVAEALAVIAGPDGDDPRQGAGVVVGDYLGEMQRDVAGLRIGLLREGFDHPNLSEADVDAAVFEAVAALERAGAIVSDVSIPWHRDAIAVWTAIALEGNTAHLFAGESIGVGWRGRYAADRAEAFAQGRRAHGGALAAGAKVTALAGRWVTQTTHLRHYAKAQNLVPVLRAAYDDALARVDVLALPTVPFKPPVRPPGDADLATSVRASFKPPINAAPLNVSGHPAISVPCALRDGLPVGLMFVGAPYAEGTLLRAAAAVERHVHPAPEPVRVAVTR